MVLGPLRPKLIERASAQLEMLSESGLHPAGGTLLDVGCSSGTFMMLAQRAGWEAVGVELGAVTAQAARDQGLDVRTGTLADVVDELEPSSFSLITFWDVLEHVRDPRQELALAQRLLRPGGAIVATMPNVAGLYPQMTYRLIAQTTGSWEYPELPVHLYDFSPATIRRLLHTIGFSDVSVRTFATPFWYYRWTSISVGALGGRFRGRRRRGDHGARKRRDHQPHRAYGGARDIARADLVVQVPDERDAGEPRRHRTIRSRLQRDRADDIRIELLQPRPQPSDVASDVDRGKRLRGSGTQLGPLQAARPLGQRHHLDPRAGCGQGIDERAVLGQQHR